MVWRPVGTHVGAHDWWKSCGELWVGDAAEIQSKRGRERANGFLRISPSQMLRRDTLRTHAAADLPCDRELSLRHPVESLYDPGTPSDDYDFLAHT